MIKVLFHNQQGALRCERLVWRDDPPARSVVVGARQERVRSEDIVGEADTMEKMHALAEQHHASNCGKCTVARAVLERFLKPVLGATPGELNEAASGHTVNRRFVPLEPGLEWREGFTATGFPVPRGYREETDAELAKRIKELVRVGELRPAPAPRVWLVWHYVPSMDAPVVVSVHATERGAEDWRAARVSPAEFRVDDGHDVMS